MASSAIRYSPGSGAPLGYHLQVIANDNYWYWQDLKYPVVDAEELSGLLRSDYGYSVRPPIHNGSREQIFQRMGELARSLTESESLIIYYSGHGYSDRQLGKTYWIPVDADRTNRSAWLSQDDLLALLKPIRARHVLVIADSCYGAVSGQGDEVSETLIDELARTRTRRALTSGRDAPVLDGPYGEHSAFTSYLLEALVFNREDVLRGTELFGQVRGLASKANQLPGYSAIQGAGDQGGDYLFVRRKREPVAMPASGSGPTASAGEMKGALSGGAARGPATGASQMQQGAPNIMVRPFVGPKGKALYERTLRVLEQNGADLIPSGFEGPARLETPADFASVAALLNISVFIQGEVTNDATGWRLQLFVRRASDGEVVASTIFEASWFPGLLTRIDEQLIGELEAAISGR